MNNYLFSKIVESGFLVQFKALFGKYNNNQNSIIKKLHPSVFFPQQRFHKEFLLAWFKNKIQLHHNNSICFLLLIFLIPFSSCNKNLTKKNITKVSIVYPSPPEQARIQYLTKITSSQDLGRKQNYFSKYILGAERPKGIVKPYGMAIHKGKIYVCDNYGGGMEIIDLEKKTVDFFKPRGRGQLKVPINCYVDDDGFLYVADAGRFEIVVFNDKGEFVKSFGEKEKFKPTDVFIYGDKIFVANPSSSKISVYSKTTVNKLLYSFPEAEQGSKAVLGLPANIAIGNEKVYAADFGYSMIKTYSPEGTFIDTIGSRGDRPGQFAKLKGIAVDRESNVYAVDAAFENVQLFNKEGKLLMVFGGHYTGPGDLIIPAKVVIDYDNLKYFQKFVDPGFDLKYLIFVTSQYGPDLINVYGRVEPKETAGK